MRAKPFIHPRSYSGIALAGLLALGAPAVSPQPNPPETVRLVLRQGSRLWLEGGSNLHDWKCEAKEFNPELRVERPTPEGPPTSVDRAVLDVPVGKIECGHGKMNDNLRKALKAGDFPSITFVVTGADFVETGTPGALELLAKGNLYVAGNGQDLQFQVSGTDTGDGALRIQGQVVIKMTDFGIQPPTAMMGLLKTKNEVTIRFDLVTEYARLAEATS
jgi:hypothetical protein